MPDRYRKRPVVIEAVQFDGATSSLSAIERWMRGGEYVKPAIATRDIRPMTMTIHTLEDPVTASPGDYIIKGVQGEFYPCKPDIFEATYERVEDTDA